MEMLIYEKRNKINVDATTRSKRGEWIRCKNDVSKMLWPSQSPGLNSTDHV